MALYHKMDLEKEAVEEIAALIPDATYRKHGGLHGAMKVIDLPRDEVYTLNFDGETVTEVVIVDRGAEKPIVIKTSQSEFISKGETL